MEWRCLEANPAVISDYVKSLGGPADVLFEDVVSLEPWAEEMLPGKVLALLFVFPLTERAVERRKTVETTAVDEDSSSQLWFTRQEVANACGTVALLHVFANLQHQLALVPEKPLAKFIAKCRSLDSRRRAAALKEDDEMASAHRKAEDKGQSAHQEDVAEHFVAFVDVNGKLFEFDGRCSGPVSHGDIPENSSFFQHAVRVIQSEFIAKDPENLRFSLIAVSKAATA